MKMFKPFLVFLLIFSFCQTKAQSRKRDWHLYGGPSIGAMYYVGDLKDDNLPASGYMHASVGLRAQSQYKNIFAIQGSYTYGGMSGYDTLIARPWAPSRAYEFTSKTHDFEVFLKYTIFNQKKKVTRSTKFVFYPKLLVGLGFLNFKPMREYQGQMIDLQALGTEGQYIDNAIYPDPYSNWAVGFKLGSETSIVIGRRTTLDFYSYYTYAQTDYLDDVGGGPHINYEDLASAPNSDVLSALAFPRAAQGNLEEAIPTYPRGSAAYKDGYFCFGMALSYRFTDLAKGSGITLPPFLTKRRF